MAAASPWCWGRGEVSFLRCSPTKARRSHLGLAGWARRQRHKMADGPAPYWVGVGKERQRFLGSFNLNRCVHQERVVVLAPEEWNLVCFGDFFCRIGGSNLKETKFWAVTGRCAGFVLGLSRVLFFDTERAFKPKLVT